MTPKRWQQIERMWDQALTRPREERDAFLGRACSGDEGLRAEVAALLAAHDQCANFLEEPAIKFVAALLAHKKMS